MTDSDGVSIGSDQPAGDETVEDCVDGSTITEFVCEECNLGSTNPPTGGARVVVDIDEPQEDASGEFLLGGFMAMQPHGELDRLLQLLANIHDEAHVQRYRTFETWFQHTQPIPGAFYLWIIEHLFQNNELVAGELMVAGQRVDLGRIDCPLYLLAGGADHITPPPQVFALAEHAGTDESRISRRTTRGGHLGLFMGHEALQRHWRALFSEIAALSRPVGS